MSSRTARAALAAGLMALAGAAGLPAQDSVQIQQLPPSLEEVSPSVEEAPSTLEQIPPDGEIQPELLESQPGTLGIEPGTVEDQPGTFELGPGVLEVSPEVLRRMTGGSVQAPETADSADATPETSDPSAASQPPEAAVATPGPGLLDSARYLTSRVGEEAVREQAVEGLGLDRQSFVLPYRVLATGGSAPEAAPEATPEVAPGPEADEVRSYLRPVIQVGGEGLSFAGSTEGYRGRIYVGVQDSLEPAGSKELPEPIHFLLDVVGGSAEPGDVAVGHTNLPFREVTVATREIRDSVRIRVRSSVHGEPTPLTLPVSRPALSVSASPPSLPGLGLETTTLTVSADRLPSRAVPVTVESTMGRPEPSQVRLGPDGPARVTLRSTGLGATEVRVRSPGYLPASTRVPFGFPLAFLAAALLGGVAGGTARHFRNQDGEEADPWLREAGVAVIFGLIVAVAYAVGVNLLGVEIGARYGEALVFTLAALGGYFRFPGTQTAGTA